jgi:subtilase family serine protease
MLGGVALGKALPGATAALGLAAEFPASIPEVTAVGGTEFAEGSGSYWESTNTATGASVRSYIPEIAWNESGSATWCPSGDTCTQLWSSSGGVSSIYTKPSWQVCTGVPSDGMRDVPDWSFNAATHDGYLVETQGALYLIGGTSASSPSSAGVMAIICQKTGSRQGLANTRIYQLANAQYASGGPVIFHDITTGNNSVPGLTGYSCTTGYDEVTGVGSVDVDALANNWVA